jgi:uncharacterized protein YkwD
MHAAKPQEKCSNQTKLGLSVILLPSIGGDMPRQPGESARVHSTNLATAASPFMAIAHRPCNRPRMGYARALLLAGALASLTAGAAETDRLIELINEYRSSPQMCEGRQTDAVGALAGQTALARPELPSKADALQNALKRAGYNASRFQLIVVSGPDNPRDAMALLGQRYCRALLSPQFADIGISRNGNTWRVVLARPLLSPDLGDWRKAGKKILDLTNAARAQPRTCGDRRFGSAAPLQWNEKLAAAALEHSQDMATHNFFSHTGKDARTVRDRAVRKGYSWRRVGENIATGQGAPRQVVAGWLTSPQHCANIMEPGFAEMGAAYFVNAKSDTAIYWTQVFGTARR